MGANSSKLEKALAEAPEDERYYGLENFGNTCYCNSVLQALYFCKPFREKLLKYATSLPVNAEQNLLNCLADLFLQVPKLTQARSPSLLSGVFSMSCLCTVYIFLIKQ